MATGMAVVVVKIARPMETCLQAFYRHSRVLLARTAELLARLQAFLRRRKEEPLAREMAVSGETMVRDMAARREVVRRRRRCRCMVLSVQRLPWLLRRR